jgi:hypothetical protein
MQSKAATSQKDPRRAALTSAERRFVAAVKRRSQPVSSVGKRTSCREGSRPSSPCLRARPPGADARSPALAMGGRTRDRRRAPGGQRSLTPRNRATDMSVKPAGLRSPLEPRTEDVPMQIKAETNHKDRRREELTRAERRLVAAVKRRKQRREERSQETIVREGFAPFFGFI